MSIAGAPGGWAIGAWAGACWCGWALAWAEAAAGTPMAKEATAARRMKRFMILSLKALRPRSAAVDRGEAVIDRAEDQADEPSEHQRPQSGIDDGVALSIFQLR